MTDTRARGFWLHAAPQAYDLNVADWIASTKTRGARTESLNVRLWLQADIQSPKIDFRLYEALSVKVVLFFVACSSLSLVAPLFPGRVLR